MNSYFLPKIEYKKVNETSHLNRFLNNYRDNTPNLNLLNTKNGVNSLDINRTQVNHLNNSISPEYIYYGKPVDERNYFQKEIRNGLNFN